MSIQVVNPATGERERTVDPISDTAVQTAVERGGQQFEEWRGASFGRRAKLLNRIADLLEDRAPEFADLMAREMGKPVSSGESEAEKCAWVCRYYADHAEDFLSPEHIATDAERSFVSYQPLGLILSIMPWNFPFWQVFRFAAPGIMAGNAVLLKHAPNVPGCAEAIENLFVEAGAPDDLFQNLFIETDQVPAILDRPEVRGVTLTGSVRAGQAVAAQAGERVKKSVLELGGSDPYLILEDANLERAVDTCVASRLLNSGQSCIAAKRLVVVESQLEEFTERFRARMEAATVGDPAERETEVGPQAREDLRDDLHRQVSESIERGATCLLGGKIPDRPGFYYPPTVLTDVGPGMPAYEEELFGPVGVVIAAEGEHDAIRIANDSDYGLGAGVFTEDVRRGERIATEELEAGCCFVNAYVKSDPRLPFGGIKQSGYGRELSHHGIKEFTNTKTVYVA